MSDKLHEEPRILAAAERRMRTDELARTSAIGLKTGPTDQATRLGPYLALSREHGAGGSMIAELLGRRLGWEVLDKNLLDRISHRYHLSRPILELVDETAASWVYDVLGTWLDRGLVPHEKYVTHLCHVVLAAARCGKVIFVGRGAPFVLPHGNGGLSVRIIAPLDVRVSQVCRDDKLSAADARVAIERIDRGRQRFVERYFHRDIDNPHCYDLVLNSARLGVEGCVQQLLLALEQRGLCGKSVA